MRFLRILLVMAFAALAVFYGMNEMSKNELQTNEGPTLSCNDEVLKLSVNDSGAALLRGVTASDAQDGDLTDKILVSGVSKLLEDNTAKVTYVVVDSDNNMQTLVRQIRYTDYRSPRFSLSEPLSYSSTQSVELLDRLTAIDSIDGDISHNIRVSYLNETDDPARYTLDIQVTNSMGDTVEMTLPVLMVDNDEEVPVIVLSDYLVYLEKGSEFDAASYIEEIVYKNEELSSRYADISGQVDTDTPGIYNVTYSYTYSKDDVTGSVILTVVVE